MSNKYNWVKVRRIWGVLSILSFLFLAFQNFDYVEIKKLSKSQKPLDSLEVRELRATTENLKKFKKVSYNLSTQSRLSYELEPDHKSEVAFAHEIKKGTDLRIKKREDSDQTTVELNMNW